MTWRVVAIGPAAGCEQTLIDVLERALAHSDTRQVIYLGQDGAATAAVEKLRGGLSAEHFLTQAVEVALRGSATQVAALLASDARGQRLSLVRCLPPAPARAVEMLERWILLSVFDKAILDEDDIANAHVILYGKSDSSALTRIGPRCFFSPGPLANGRIGVLSVSNQGDLELHIEDLEGRILQQDELPTGPPKLVVTP